MHLLFAEINPIVLFVAGLIMVVGLTMRWTRQRMRRGQSTKQLPLGHNGTTAGDRLSAPPASLELWEVRMHETARDLSGQLDTKIRIAQQLVLRAEQQSARLEAALDRAEKLLEHNSHTPNHES